MKPHSSLAATAVAMLLGLGALSAHAETSSAGSASVEAKPVTVPTPMGPHLNESPSTVITGTIEGLTDKGAAAATANLSGDTKATATPAPTVATPKPSTKRVKGAKVRAKGVAQILTAAKPAASTRKAQAQANASVDAKVQTN